jgi:hypothetical protein
MFEALESRQFFSATALCDGSVAPAPATTDAVVVESKTTKPKPSTTTQTYMQVQLENVLVSSY